MTSLKEALAAIPARRDKLNAIDDQLATVIRHIEHVLHKGLKISTPCEITYVTEEGRFFLGYGKWNGTWSLIWGREEDDDTTKDTALISAARAVRAEVFTLEPDTGQSPIERLLVEAAESLSYYADERTPQIETANRLLATLADAGYPLVA